MTDEHDHGEDDSFKLVPCIRNYTAWMAVSAGSGAVFGGVLERYSGSGLGSILLSAGIGALGFVAVFCSTEYTIQKNRYDATMEREKIE